MAVLAFAVEVMKVSGGEVALLAVEIVRTVVFDGKGNIEIEGIFALMRAAFEAAVRVSHWAVAAVEKVVVTWLSSPAATADVNAAVAVLRGPIGCWISTKFVFSVVVLSSTIGDSFSEGLRSSLLNEFVDLRLSRRLKFITGALKRFGDDDVDGDGDEADAVDDVGDGNCKGDDDDDGDDVGDDDGEGVDDGQNDCSLSVLDSTL